MLYYKLQIAGDDGKQNTGGVVEGRDFGYRPVRKRLDRIREGGTEQEGDERVDKVVDKVLHAHLLADATRMNEGDLCFIEPDLLYLEEPREEQEEEKTRFRFN